MAEKIWFSFIPFIAVMMATIGLGSYAVFRAGVSFEIIHPGAPQTVIAWLFLFLPLALVTSMLVGQKFHNPIIATLHTLGGLWLGILMYLFIETVVISILSLLGKLLHFNLPFHFIAWGFIYLTLLLVIYGIIHARNIHVRKYEIESEALRTLWSGKNIVLVSDTHIGQVRGKHFMEKVVRKINSLNPDIVLIAGDIIDGPALDYEKDLSPLRDVKSTFGIFYTPGNHEGYNREPEKFLPVVKSLTRMLVDERVVVNGTQIIGLEYKIETITKTGERLTKTGYKKDPAIPSIILLHDPKNTAALEAAGVSLIVSGHTHLGQFFPITSIVRKIYKKFAYGMVNEKAGTISITSSGVGTALSPLRIGSNSEIVLIKIK